MGFEAPNWYDIVSQQRSVQAPLIYSLATVIAVIIVSHSSTIVDEACLSIRVV